MTTLYMPMLRRDTTVHSKRCAANTGNAAGAIAALGLRSLRSWSLTPQQYSNCEVLACVWGDVAANVIINGGAATVTSTSIVLGFNEPDMTDQSNLTPAQAVPLWRGVREVLDGSNLASPAPCMDVGWLPEFCDEYEAAYPLDPPVPFDVLDFHLYWDDVGLCQYVASQYIDMAEFYGVQAIVSEFAFGHMHGVAQGVQDMAEFIPWLDAQPRIQRYYWFGTSLTGQEPWLPDGWEPTGLVEPGGTALTQYGIVYRA